ncbi:MAG: FtsH-binding integral membrane protein [Candidatus Deianiraeaceae bacterium]|jgi:FtsH-binding integral membrane protein
MNTVYSTSQTNTGGLRDYMAFVYKNMSFALALTGVVAYIFSQMIISSPALQHAVFQSPLRFIIMFAPLGMALFLGAKINSMSFIKARGLFYGYAVLMGLSLSSILLMYTGQSVARVFFITAITFASMSMYGYTTKKDLSAFGSFLMMALIGVIVASIVNIFMHSNVMSFILSIFAVLIFTGLTAYDTQKIKTMYYHYQSGQIDDEGIKKVAIMGAFSLYLDFINIFIHLLYLFGDRR